MPGQYYSVGSLGGYAVLPKLSQELRHQAQPLTRFRQFTTIIDKEFPGAKPGAVFNWDIISNVAAAGTKVAETSSIPRTNFVITQGTGTVSEYGNAIPYTELLDRVSELKITDGIKRALRNDMVKTLDKAVEAEFNACKIRYVGTSTGGGVFTTNGTATATCNSRLNTVHVRNIVDYMRATMLAPPYEGDSYMCITTINGYRGMYDDVQEVIKYTKYPANGEFGMYYNVRFIQETNAMRNNMGTGSAYGEAYFFGDDAVAEAVVLPEEIRFMPDSTLDFGRSPALAWYFIGGFKIIHAGNPNNVIVKYDSA